MEQIPEEKQETPTSASREFLKQWWEKTLQNAAAPLGFSGAFVLLAGMDIAQVGPGNPDLAQAHAVLAGVGFSLSALIGLQAVVSEKLEEAEWKKTFAHVDEILAGRSTHHPQDL